VVVGVLAAAAGIAVSRPAGPAGGAPGGGPPDIGRMLIEGLRATEGCLGVEAAAMQFSQMNTIIAWFENKEAAKRWYLSETHTRVMRMVGDDPANHEPMAGVPDDVPIMVMASIQMGTGKAGFGGPVPIDAISIELYTPLPGGAMAGGRLAPKGFRISGMDGAEDMNAAD
jgi:hypothetical protein